MASLGVRAKPTLLPRKRDVWVGLRSGAGNRCVFEGKGCSSRARQHSSLSYVAAGYLAYLDGLASERSSQQTRSKSTSMKRGRG